MAEWQKTMAVRASSMHRCCYSELAAALIVDYCDKSPFALSLRGIQKHKFVHPLSDPGLVDLVRLLTARDSR